MSALAFRDKPVFALSVYLHSLTFVLLGMFVASSAGEVLFNNEEADILLHRPIEPRTLLWAKIGVLIEVSLWIAAALNAVGLLVGACGTIPAIIHLIDLLDTLALHRLRGHGLTLRLGFG